MKRAIALTYVLGLFLLGGVIGALGMHLYHAEKGEPPRPPRAGMPAGGHDRGRGGLPPLFRFLDGTERLAWLELTDDQRAAIGEILDTGRREMDTLRAELRPRIERHAQETRRKIEALLTAEQRTKLAEYLERDGPPHRRRRSQRP